ncbi:hypothetical protein nbrc107696_12860 [Gordonia spumicola]|uniref:Uncharacterized protein n=1 Tax=Gordonia spumicola TaxID=589161 RepID=A0A7I9V6Z8_9ACTN|nr:hypothetical protein [Gordonia spumicola]GEE00840.1 hypothetical protein nbrc107696_12860 [Gordonia spumicola]
MSTSGYNEYQHYPPTMHGGHRPPNRRTPLIIAFTVAGIALIIAIVAVAVAVLKANDSNEASPSTQVTTTTIQQTAADAPQTQATTAPQPTVSDVRGSLASQGYVYPCGSSVFRNSEQTQCGWAENVRQATLSRGSFSGVPIYSPYLGYTVSTTCSDRGSYYICQGQTVNTIAVIK